ncbi:MAG: hypothetical protein PHV08_06955 [Sulfurovaceae bacterium]|nr:hypothetical protein [Sulfurovaceae bacterium]
MRTEFVKFRVSVQEKDFLKKQSSNANLCLGAYLRNLGLGYPVRSMTDIQTAVQIKNSAASLGRLGGLFKLWLSNTKEEWDPRLGDKSSFKIELLVREIEQNKQELLEIARRLL